MIPKINRGIFLSVDGEIDTTQIVRESFSRLPKETVITEGQTQAINTALRPIREVSLDVAKPTLNPEVQEQLREIVRGEVTTAPTVTTETEVKIVDNRLPVYSGGGFGGGFGGGGAASGGGEEEVPTKKCGVLCWLLIAGMVYGGYKLIK